MTPDRSKELRARCTGGCCKRFTLPGSPDELRADAEAHRRGTPHRWAAEIQRIADMVIYLGFSDRGHNGEPGGYSGEATPKHWYTCAYFDGVSHNCLIYGIRPGMCRDYPAYGDPESKCGVWGCRAEGRGPLKAIWWALKWAGRRLRASPEEISTNARRSPSEP